MKKILIFFLSYQNFLFCQFNPVSLISGQINNRQLDNNLEVGTISGNISVSPTGSATYNIPLELPKGVGDISPKISISYNQQSTNGLLGFGWSVDGLSSIMRTTNSLYYDEYKSSINLDIYDAISLDNQRLLPISGGILSNGSIYGFEIEDYTRVEITTGGINGSSPEIFEVKKDNGIIAQYGGNNSFMQSTSGIKYIWRLNKMYDNSGNYINYVYGNRGPNYTGESYIDYIEYTGNTILGIAPQIKIKFNYGLFTKLPYSYVCGNEVSRELILTSIDIYVSNTRIKRYEFNYFETSHSNFNIFLAEIKLIAGINSQVNSTIINWGEESNSFEVIDFNSNGSLSNPKFTIGDFNGDGVNDILNYNETSYSLFNGSKNGFSMVSSGNIGGKRSIAFDINNDGVSDWLVFNNQAVGGIFLSSYQFLNNIPITSSGLWNPSFNAFDYNFSTNQTVDKTTFLPGDIDGNGIPDVSLAYHSNSSNTSCCKTMFQEITYSSFSSSYNYKTQLISDELINLGLSSVQTGTNYFTTDINGNGINEIFATNYKNSINNYAFIELKNGNQAEVIIHNNLSIPINTQHEKTILTSDINGDGKTDLLVYNHFDKYWKQYTSDGKTLNARFLGSELPFIAEPGKFNLFFLNSNQYVIMNGPESQQPIAIGDFNGDGYSDFANLKIYSDVPYPFPISFLIYKLEVYYYNGKSFINSGFEIDLGTTPNILPIIPELHAGDFNGDGITDLFVDKKYLNQHKIVYFNKNDKSKYIKSITNGFNYKIDINYNTLTNSSLTEPDVYGKTNFVVNNNLVKIQIPINVVSSMSIPNGLGGISTTKYLYHDLVLQPMGKGIMGFREFRIQDQNGWLNVFRNTFNNTSDPDIIITEVESYYSNNIYINNPIDPRSTEMVFYNYSNNSTGNIFDIRNRKTLSLQNYDYENNTSSVTDYYYNNNNELFKTRKRIYNNIVISSGLFHTNIVEINNFISLNGFINRRPSSVTTTEIDENNISFSKVKEFTYNNNFTGSIASITDNPNDPNFEVVTSFDYNPNGTIFQKNIIGTSVNANYNIRTEQFVYDPYFRFIEQTKHIQFSSINAFTTKFNNLNDAVFQKYDLQNNLVEENIYDDFGRLISSTDAYGNILLKGVSWSDKPQYLYFIRTYGNNVPETKDYYDLLGRNVYSEKEGYNGTLIVQRKSYNSNGLVASETNPYFPNETPIITDYTYDNHNKILGTTNSCNLSTSYQYPSFRKIVFTDPSGRSKSETMDPLGRVIENIDIGGNITTNIYRPDGLVSSINSGGLITNFDYDLNGNKVLIEESNSGSPSFKYNALNLLEKSKDSKGNMITFLYNSDHSLLKKSITHFSKSYPSMSSSPDPRVEEIIYTYYNSIGANGYGKLQQETNSKGDFKNYSYDVNGNLIIKLEKIKQKYLETKYEYNSSGLLNKLYYPNGFTIGYTYNAIGQLYEVFDINQNKKIYHLNSVDALGRERSAVWGDNPNFNQNPVDFPFLGAQCAVFSYTSYSSCMD